ncbi:MAG: primosomal protein N' [Candidatus Saccharimonadales bacterium]
MHYYEVAPNKIIRADASTFTYSCNQTLSIGQIVIIEIGKKSTVGVVIQKVSKPTYKTKDVTTIITDVVLPPQLVSLASWLSSYYASPLANVIQTILPRGIDKKRRLSVKEPQKITKRDRTNILFNDEQNTVIKSLEGSGPGTFLLHGVTGSGKTEIYIKTAKDAVNDDKSAIILVPEIALTPQLISEFSNHFDNLLVTHSKMSESARHKVWLEALSSTTPRVVIGPRSALFLPLKNIGVIAIDEAHEPSYKQEQSPKYSALRAASILGRLHNAQVILGSATPSVIDKYLAEKSEKPLLRLSKPARNNSVQPNIKLIDMTSRKNFSQHRFLSDFLIEQIKNTLADKKQSLIFHNRRGSTGVTLCEKCGWTAVCPKCQLPLTLHTDKHLLLCHICGHSTKAPTNCPICQSTDIIHKGIGVKLVESELKRMFPNANIARFDNDNNSQDSMDKRYDDIYNGNIDIIIGTQTVAKGLDLPNLRTVGVVQADTGLVLPDYTAEERTFQLLAQVVGRVGRDKNQTNVIIQTYQPNHQIILSGLNQDYESFYKYILEKRRAGSFPPYSYLLKLTCAYKTEAAAIKNSRDLAAKLRQAFPDIKISGPTPSFYEHFNDSWRWQLVLKSKKRETLIQAIKLVPQNYWQYDIDPTSLL